MVMDISTSNLKKICIKLAFEKTCILYQPFYLIVGNLYLLYQFFRYAYLNMVPRSYDRNR